MDDDFFNTTTTIGGDDGDSGTGIDVAVEQVGEEDIFWDYYVEVVLDFTIFLSFTWLGACLFLLFRSLPCFCVCVSVLCICLSGLAVSVLLSVVNVCCFVF